MVYLKISIKYWIYTSPTGDKLDCVTPRPENMHIPTPGDEKATDEKWEQQIELAEDSGR